MGTTRTPKNRVELFLNDKSSIVLEFRGRVNQKNLDKFINDFNQSLKPGGVNGHLSSKIILRVRLARVVRQKDGAQLCTYVAPMFEII